VGERLLWADLRKLGLNLRRQAPIGRYVVDFVHFESRLVIELDGPVHDRPEVAARDAVRDAWLAGQGFRILHFEARRAIEDREPLVEAIRSAILSPPSQPFPHQGGRLYGAPVINGCATPHPFPRPLPDRREWEIRDAHAPAPA
jgi:very-short-patch-repair endonuclease